ncbi:hypothetical protein HY045_02020 [Candidatus Woesebacteria bacterium]|nr:hypothetical protein [Candidatus Woesebacteria bacterium]
MDNYQLFKRNDFPLPNTVRRIKGENAVIMTDLTQCGERIVFSVNEIEQKVINPVSLISNLEEVYSELIRLAEMADKINIVLGQDVYSIVIGEYKNASVVLVDLGIGIFRPLLVIIRPGENEKNATNFYQALVTGVYQE